MIGSIYRYVGPVEAWSAITPNGEFITLEVGDKLIVTKLPDNDCKWCELSTLDNSTIYFNDSEMADFLELL